MLIHDLAAEVHENALRHGWWDTDRGPMEIIALIHSEWSEALEEARAGRPMVYVMDIWGDEVMIPMNREGKFLREDGTALERLKPEGIAVEMIDGVIRILDYFAELGGSVMREDGSDESIEHVMSFIEEDWGDGLPEDVPGMVALLHKLTSDAMPEDWQGEWDGAQVCNKLLHAAVLAMVWVKRRRLDPVALLQMKNTYNRSRPYRHGKLF